MFYEYADRLIIQRTERQRTAFFQKIPTESRQRTGSRQKNPDRQAPDSVFSKNPDRIRTADKIETDRIRTDRHRTANPDRIRTADRHRTRFSGKSGQKRDKDRTRTVLSADVCFIEHGQIMTYGPEWSGLGCYVWDPMEPWLLNNSDLYSRMLLVQSIEIKVQMI